MYGMVNNALREFVLERHGDEAWQSIRRTAGLEADAPFVGMQSYPDALTYGLIGAASDLLAQPVAKLLHELGLTWVGFAARSGHATLIDRSGRTFVEFLQHLDAMHARLTLTLPELRPPTISVSDVTADSLLVHYKSHREGLEPFVVGLLHGLAQRFGNSIEVEQTKSRANTSERATFLVRYR